MKPKITFLSSATSTNSYLTRRAESLTHGEAVVALAQTAGRGQRGNSWESEPGQNLTLSVLLRPADIDISRAFPLSEAVAMAAVAVLDRLMPDCPEPITVKWPNDIYAGNSKIAGILIENSISGRIIARSVAGIGLNVNQKHFYSNAPNPISIVQLSGRQYPIPMVATMFLNELDRMMRLIESDPAKLHTLYMSRLWRAKGVYPFREVASDERFEAEVTAVAPSGFISLTDTTGRVRTYAFKEIEWLRD